jgi:hypothetical protein
LRLPFVIYLFVALLFHHAILKKFVITFPSYFTHSTTDCSEIPSDWYYHYCG